MFDGIVEQYDAVNSILSLGLDRWWRRQTINAVRVEPGDRTLDLGCGTGVLGARLADEAEVVGVDLSHPMLAYGRRQWGHKMSFVQGSAFRLPFPDAAFRVAVSGFVLRNLDDLPAAFAELARVVSPGGRIGLVDITRPTMPTLRRIFDGYLAAAAPAVGSLVGKREAYRYLVRSVAHLPPSDEVCGMLESAGFEDCEARPLTWGRVTLFTAMRR